jgi:hypothetical protein
MNFIKWFKSQDDFGAPIGLNYRGAGTHKTVVGACTTICFKVFMIYIAIMRTLKWIGKHDPKFSPVVIHTDLHELGDLNIAEH